jgi:hypothetical protein
MFWILSSSGTENHKGEEFCQTHPYAKKRYAQIMLDVVHCQAYV